MTLSIIGLGNIGGAIARGLLEAKADLDGIQLHLTRRNLDALEEFTAYPAVTIGTDNAEAIRQADIVLFTLPPSAVPELIQRHAELLLSGKKVLASVATNVSLLAMQQALREGLPANRHAEIQDLPIYRIMPNTAIAVRESMTCISRQHQQPEHDAWIEKLFRAVGDVLFIEDRLMNAATVLCACGTAFALRYIRAASQGGTEIGFHAEDAIRLAAQTVKGAATLLTETGQHPEQAIDAVTTPQGCTIAGINEMEHQGFSSAVIRGVSSSHQRACNL